MAGLGNVAALILAIAILQLAQGLLSVFFPLAMSADGMPPIAVGLVGAAYSAGFMAGAWVGPTLLARSGHIRVFAACGAIAAAATLSVHFAGGAIGWMCARAAMGAAVALLFAAAESWMNASLGKSERGRIIGVYMVTTKAALVLGPFLTYGFSASAPEPLMVAAAIIALAIVPICFTTTKQPEPPKAQPLALREQFATAPAAVTACFGAGVLNAAVLTLSPLYAKDHFGEASATTFQAAAQFGSLLLQYPAGRLSDRIDRRLVIAGLSAIAAVAAAFLTIFGGELSFTVATLLFAIWGAGSLSFYGIAVAHMADRADPTQIARATSGLLFVWALGSVVGPLTAGAVTSLFGQNALFAYACVLGVALSGFMAIRSGLRRPSLRLTREAKAPTQATSVVAAEMAYGEAGDPKP
ncbi:MAG: MFS transporter [Caulobacterales bacterium]